MTVTREMLERWVRQLERADRLTDIGVLPDLPMLAEMREVWLRMIRDEADKK